jgi:hypothetical protein
MERTHLDRFVPALFQAYNDLPTNCPQLMLQTAPIVLLFPPTVGPGATADGTPQRFDLFG